MNRQLTRNFGDIARQTGLALDVESEALWGEIGGFPVIIHAPNANYPGNLAALFAAASDTAPLTDQAAKQLKKSIPGVQRVDARSMGVTVYFRYKRGGDMAALLNAAAAGLAAAGMRRCCQHCGADKPAQAAMVGGAYLSLCDDCFDAIGGHMELAQGQQEAKGENVLAGAVGALLGSLAGVACIVLLSQLGYIAALSGIVMAACTLWCYEKLGRRLSVKGVVISGVIMTAMTYFADRLDWAIIVARELGMGLFESYQAIPLLMEMEAIDAGAYWMNLGLVYLFVLLGAVPMSINGLRGSKLKNRIARLTDSSRSTVL